ncbi:hypothetical protein [Tautonia plasticadhaerens]|uniref:Terminase-like family protein n=1 Tax=Tautonia plasticadhaerens TaxID=2527974 RepID=A0A518HBP6_9BACT|nr:hypothetical protein [Tautonia plasticadhaerens]QDV38271.1 Terminase-like family protein [Tautonia plasticadhaerens]
MTKRRRETTPEPVPSLGSRPDSERSLRRWVREYAGLRIPHRAVCRGHQSPWRFFADAFLLRPPVALVLGPRGGGKSYLSALETHLTSRFDPGHGTRLLGGSLAQSQQAHQALAELARDDPALAKLTESKALYANGSEVRVLAASPTSVRGPHVPSLKLDEVDEIDPECRDAALGMCMNRGETPASVLMTSTWHRVDGPMSRLIERAHAGEFPFYSFCVFEVLERCPDRRSGRDLEKCPECPLVSWCHEDRDADPLGRPKAKRATGHYGIDALIQKARVVSGRTFEADYLCRGPKADGLWFAEFDPVVNVSEAAEYDPTAPVHLAIDSGVHTGAVYFQVVARATPSGMADEVHVFAEYLEEGKTAEHNAREILELSRARCNGRIDVASTDPAGNARTAVGPTVLGEYERTGLRNLSFWPSGASVTDGLALVESFLRPADGGTRLLVHPRCEHTVRAFRNYRREKRAGQWTDRPEDPQHPHEDLLDALRGGLRNRYPEGRRPPPPMGRVPARSVF